eukprot:UN20448
MENVEACFGSILALDCSEINPQDRSSMLSGSACENVETNMIQGYD